MCSCMHVDTCLALGCSCSCQLWWLLYWNHCGVWL